MVCYHPVLAYQHKETKAVMVVGNTGKFPSGRDMFKWKQFFVPCNGCSGCRLEYSRQWALRCVHEASLYDDNCFVTLTYDDDHLPDDRSLDYRHFQLFNKRIRKEFGSGIRFFMCGEYGEQYGRPHYHCLYFNHDFHDRTVWKRTKSGELIYRSASLERLWTKGHSSVGEMTWNSAAYVARYIFKKRTGKDAKDHYFWTDDSGNRFYRLPEFTQCSRMPGIGKPWLEKFSRDVYPSDFVTLRGRKFRPPRYYDKVMANSDKDADRELHAIVKADRQERAEKHAADNTPERLAVREKIHLRRIDKLGKSL
jgi:hypothetical protein